MTKYIVKKGEHYGSPSMIGLWYNKGSITKKVLFDKSCEYEPDAEGDISKLFGIRYVMGNPNDDSARFGWRWNKEKRKIEVFGYAHVKGRIEYKFICDCTLGKQYEMELIIMKGQYFFSVRYSGNGMESQTIQFFHNKSLAVPMGLYFGGNAPAPHDLFVKM